jgi:hypothetical protein
VSINFPTTPALNETYSAAGRTWSWNGAAWQLQTPMPSTGYTGSMGLTGNLGYTGSQGPIGYVGSQGAVDYTFSNVAPISPLSGTVWIDSESGINYFYVDDGDSGQWVEFSNTGTKGPIGYTGSKGDPDGYTGSVGYTGSQAESPSVLIIPVTGETGIITSGTAKYTFRSPFQLNLTESPRASLTTASTSGSVVVDINVNGVSMFGTDKLSVDQNEKTSLTASIPAIYTPTVITADSEITFDIDSAGTSAVGLKVTLYYYRGDYSSTTPTFGSQIYGTPGTYSWVCPMGVYAVSAVAVGGGGGGGGANGAGGGGGGLGYKNNIPVTPGQTYTVVVGAGGIGGNAAVAGTNGADSYFISQNTACGLGGKGGASYNTASADSGQTLQGGFGGGYTGDGGGFGGKGGNTAFASGYTGEVSGGGGGAAGYSGSGGWGAATGYSGSTGVNGGGGGGGSGNNVYGNGNGTPSGGGGGGTGLFGQGANGTGGARSTSFEVVPQGGSGGSGAGYTGSNGSINFSGGNAGGAGGWPGGGAAGNSGVFNSQGYIRGQINNGGHGAVRLVWGVNRAFPSTNVNY